MGSLTALQAMYLRHAPLMQSYAPYVSDHTNQPMSMTPAGGGAVCLRTCLRAATQITLVIHVILCMWLTPLPTLQAVCLLNKECTHALGLTSEQNMQTLRLSPAFI